MKKFKKLIKKSGNGFITICSIAASILVFVVMCFYLVPFMFYLLAIFIYLGIIVLYVIGVGVFFGAVSLFIAGITYLWGVIFRKK